MFECAESIRSNSVASSLLAPIRSTPNGLRPQMLVGSRNHATFPQRTPNRCMHTHVQTIVLDASRTISRLAEEPKSSPLHSSGHALLTGGPKDTTAPSPPLPTRPAGLDKAAIIPPRANTPKIHRPQYAYHSIAGQIDVDCKANGAVFISALRMLYSCVHARTEWSKEPFDLSELSREKDFFTYLYQMRLAGTTARLTTRGSGPMPMARRFSDLHTSEIGGHQFIQLLIVLYHSCLAFGSAQESHSNRDPRFHSPRWSHIHVPDSLASSMCF